VTAEAHLWTPSAGDRVILCQEVLGGNAGVEVLAEEASTLAHRALA
jgi:hypothetical protein